VHNNGRYGSRRFTHGEDMLSEEWMDTTEPLHGNCPEAPQFVEQELR